MKRCFFACIEKRLNDTKFVVHNSYYNMTTLLNVTLCTEQILIFRYELTINFTAKKGDKTK